MSYIDGQTGNFNYSFITTMLFSVKLDLEYNIMIDTIDNSFSFPKYYYTRNNELFFSSELRGICNIEKKKK